MSRHCRIQLILQPLILLLVVAVYFPGLNGPMVFDDFPNIVENERVHISRLDWQSVRDAAFSTSTGPLSRPIPMLSFALNYYWGGGSEFSYKIANVGIHYLNGVLVFLLGLRLLPRALPSVGGTHVAGAALIASLIWLLHPLNVTSVLYVVQRMVELSTFFGLLCVLAYVNGRESKTLSFAIAWHLASGLMFLLALLCKENLIILVPLIIWIEFVLYRFEFLHSGYARLLKSIFLASILVIVWYVATNFSEFLAGYEFRPFTMTERLLTQSRVIFFYLSQIFVPNIGTMHLFHDEFTLSKSILSPPSTVFSIAGVFLLAVSAFFLRKKYILFSLALGWFLIGHLVESTFVSLELVHNHRNYFPMIGFCVWLVAVGLSLHQKWPWFSRGSVVAIIFLLGTATYHRALDWSSWEVLVVTEAEKNPASARSQYEAGRYYYWLVQKDGKLYYRKENYEKAVYYFERGASSDSSSLTSLAALVRLADLVGVQPKQEWTSQILHRIGTLRPYPNDINKVSELYKCRFEELCTVETKFLSEVAYAAIGNKNLASFSQAAIASAASGLALKEGRSDFAIYYAMAALERSPQTFEFLLNAMKLASLHSDMELAGILVNEYLPKLDDATQRERIQQEYQLLLTEQGVPP